MIVRILVRKGFDRVAIQEEAKYLNNGDIFLPDGTGWEFKVINKVLTISAQGAELNVMVEPLSQGAREYARINQANIDLKQKSNL